MQSFDAMPAFENKEWPESAAIADVPVSAGNASNVELAAVFA
ncbi:hypothetical protein [Dechloromonas denitrificans]|nr:hypothetical protein [Dechloromonas denitrificans]